MFIKDYVFIQVNKIKERHSNYVNDRFILLVENIGFFVSGVGIGIKRVELCKVKIWLTKKRNKLEV